MGEPPISKLRHIATSLRRVGEHTRALLDESHWENPAILAESRWGRFAHFWMLVGKSFSRNRGYARAAALAYTTVLALVPLLAVAVSVSSGFLSQEGGKKPIYDLITATVEKLAPALNLEVKNNEESAIARLNVAEEIQKSIEKVNSGTLGATGVLALLFVAISLLSTIEDTFNDMWGVAKGRSWFARIVQYWATVTLGPFFLVVALGLTSARQFQQTHTFIAEVPILGGMVFYLLPYLVLSVACSLLYLVMPNTKVDWRAALVGGTVAGTLLQLNNSFSVIYVSKVVTYDKLYGGLGVLPVFLVALYFSWLILLFGAQVGYAYQNRKAYMQEKQAERINQRGREFVALRIATFVAECFSKGKNPPSALTIAQCIGVPLRLAGQILQLLCSSRIVAEVSAVDSGYVPARPLRQITEEDILIAMRVGTGQDVETAEHPARQLLRQDFQAIQEAEQTIARSTTLEQLVDRIEAARDRSSPSA